MKKLNLWAVTAVLVSFTTLNVSCKQESLSEASLTTTAQDETQASTLSDDAISNADEYVNTSLTNAIASVPEAGIQRVAAATGPTVTVDKTGNVFPKTITIDFGTTGMTGKRGNTLKGKIIVVVTGRMDLAGSSRTYTFDNFSINDNAVKGTKTVTYNGETNGNKNWTVVVKDTIVKADDGKTIISNSTRIRTRTSDNGTPNIYFDDKYSIEGSATGVNANGVAYSVQITKPLVLDGAWPVFVSGTMVITTEKRSVITDFGDGTRDRLATVTIDSVTKTITLRK